MSAEPSTLGTLSASATVDALADSCVIRWWQTTTFIVVEGVNAVTCLDGLCTQHVATIPPGTAQFGMFLTNKARIIAATLVWRDHDQGDQQRVLLEIDPALVDDLVSHLKKFKLRAKATFTPTELATVALYGRGAPHHPVAAGEGWYDLPDAGTPVRGFVGTSEDVAKLMGETLPALGIAPADPDALDAVRIISGMPALNDLLAGRMPAEVGGVEIGVDFEKGCYLGQEPVARLHWRGQSQRSLRTAQLDDDLPSACDLELFRTEEDASTRAAGEVTSWAREAGGSWVALAMLRRDVDDGIQLRVGSTNIQLTPRSFDASST